LTLPLADFANLVELFDAHGVSLVSVTQQFNTTTSMGEERERDRHIDLAHAAAVPRRDAYRIRRRVCEEFNAEKPCSCRVDALVRSSGQAPERL